MVDQCFKLSCILLGVVNSKWHKKVKITPQARLKLSQANDELDFERREAIFSDNRLELCVEFKLIFCSRKGNNFA